MYRLKMVVILLEDNSLRGEKNLLRIRQNETRYKTKICCKLN